MDLREIIKWFIPCFHILLMKLNRIDTRFTVLCIFLFFNCCLSSGAHVNSFKVSLSDDKFADTKNVGLLNALDIPKLNQSDVVPAKRLNEDARSAEDSSVGRTFGRPLKKMMSALIPLIFQIGAASTWAVVAALVGIKTLAVTLIILKLLLVAGAAKVGALFSNKGHHQQQPHGWEPHQKEIHLHIHNGGHNTPHEQEHIASWNRNEVQLVKPDKNLNMVINPYSAGPQTISTPFGNYVRID